MKILQVAHSFVPYTMAGTEVYAYNLARELSGRHEVSVFFRINDPKQEEYALTHSRMDGFDTYAINHTFKYCGSFSATYNDESIDHKFAELLDKIKPDIVHIHHLLFLSLGITGEIKKRGIPVIYTLHDYWLICYRGQLIDDKLRICVDRTGNGCAKCLRHLVTIRKNSIYFYSLLKRALPKPLVVLLKKIYFYMARRPTSPQDAQAWKDRLVRLRQDIDLFLAPSRFIKDVFIEAGILAQKIVHTPYGFEVKRFSSTAKTKSRLLRFGYTGTLLPMKGVDILVSAFKQIENKDIELSIYGKLFSYSGFETYPNFLKKMVRGDNRIKLKGGFDNSQVARILADIDVLVVPSIWQENAPLVIQEAFLSGTPVIASRIGGVPELVSDGANGLLFEAGNADDLREKLQYVIGNPDTLKQFRENIPAVKSIEDNARELEGLYARLLTPGVSTRECLLQAGRS